MKQTKPFEMELGGDTYRPALDLNATICIRRETGHTHEALIARIANPHTDAIDRIDALSVLVWGMIKTDCALRLRKPHPDLAQVVMWFQEDGESVAAQITKFFGVSAEAAPEGSLAPFVPTPYPVVSKMIELAEIKPGEHVVDLGAGDGRILFAAVDAADDVTATGYETHEGRAKALADAIAAHPKSDQLAAIPVDIRMASIRQADVVFLYLLTGSNAHLKPKLLREMKPGARVVSHDFSMPDWEPEQIEGIKAEGRVHTVYQWRIPPK